MFPAARSVFGCRSGPDHGYRMRTLEFQVHPFFPVPKLPAPTVNEDQGVPIPSKFPGLERPGEDDLVDLKRMSRADPGR